MMDFSASSSLQKWKKILKIYLVVSNIMSIFWQSINRLLSKFLFNFLNALVDFDKNHTDLKTLKLNATIFDVNLKVKFR